MKIQDIVMNASIYLGESDIVNYIENTPENPPAETLVKVDTMVRLCNLVLSELASTYLPVIKTESVESANGKITFASLAETPLNIVGVYDETDDELSYKIFPEYLTTSSRVKKIKYSFVPANYDLGDTIDYTERDISANILAFGLIAEVCLTEGRFDEAVSWRNRFSEDLNKILKPRNAVIKGREFL